MGFFEVQQLLLYLNSMAKTAQAAIAFNDPMTGDNQGREFLPLAFPTARKAFGWPIACAISL